MGSGSFEPPELNKTGFISNIQVHVKNENPPREPDFEACADFSASFQAKLLGHTGNPYHLAIMNGGPNLSPAYHQAHSA
ncbi:hypothetical protein POTOM_042524 [Populus tomentosa]|uniref:Uncharacterized protein n=1 Tax=Populus tomentosa TaxID=118781 RepID=A0A8X7YR08_POPTO|nr:hypothetical protein POTOM_042524 [Populus tomentosa]